MYAPGTPYFVFWEDEAPRTYESYGPSTPIVPGCTVIPGFFKNLTDRYVLMRVSSDFKRPPSNMQEKEEVKVVKLENAVDMRYVQDAILNLADEKNAHRKPQWFKSTYKTCIAEDACGRYIQSFLAESECILAPKRRTKNNIQKWARSARDSRSGRDQTTFERQTFAVATTDPDHCHFIQEEEVEIPALLREHAVSPETTNVLTVGSMYGVEKVASGKMIRLTPATSQMLHDNDNVDTPNCLVVYLNQTRVYVITNVTNRDEGSWLVAYPSNTVEFCSHTRNEEHEDQEKLDRKKDTNVSPSPAVDSSSSGASGAGSTAKKRNRSGGSCPSSTESATSTESAAAAAAAASSTPPPAAGPAAKKRKPSEGILGIIKILCSKFESDLEEECVLKK